MNEKGYRGVKLPSYSLLKRIDNSGPKAIISEFKGGSEVLEFGDLVDCLMLQPEELDNKFYFKPIEKPTGQLYELAEQIIIDCQNDNTPIGSYINNIEAVLSYMDDMELLKSVKSEEKRIAKFDNDLFWNYLDARQKSEGKTVFSPQTLDDATEAVKILNTHKKTTNIFKSNKAVEVINQLKLQGNIEGNDVKVMLDRIHINHKTKTITPYDLKCTDVRLQSFLFIFMKMKYYLQASLYSHILVQWAKENYPDYVVEEFRFIVYSRNDKHPAIYVVSDTWLNNGFHGFIDYKNNKVKGVKQLLEDYYYYINTDSFEIEREFIENNEIYIL